MRRLDLVFLAVLLTVVTVCGGGMRLLHDIQVRRNSSALLDRARRAEAGNDLQKAEQSLRQYLNVRLEDGAAWKSYARVVEERCSDRRGRERVFLVHEQALRYNPGDRALERRCADLALDMERYSDAQRHLTSLLEQVTNDPQGRPVAAKLAELEDLLGQCNRGLTRYEDAQVWFVKSLEHDARRVDCYDRLARLRRTELRRLGAADGTIREMVTKNPQAGRAYVYRWRYDREFAPPAEAIDVQRALNLAPDDPEVLLTAAIASDQKEDAASARGYWEKGFKVEPRSVSIALGLARLETREKHLDRAEAVLRQALEVNPSVDLAFELALTLILEDKIDGKDGAGEYIARLRTAGFGDTYVHYLEASIPFQRKQWAEAIGRIDTARSALGPDSRLTSGLNIMLAECYGRVGSDEQRLAALRQVAEGDLAPDAARIELAHALTQSGKLDQAIAILVPVAERKPDLRLELVRLLIQRTSRQPRDQRIWPEVEHALVQAERALSREVEPLVLLRVELLIAQDRRADALSLLSRAHAKDPRNLRYRLGLARLTQRTGAGAAALQVLERAEKDLGRSLDLQLARLDHWGLEGGDAATAAVAKLAETRRQLPDADRARYLDRLAAVEIRLGEPARARQYWRELAGIQPANLQVLAGLLDLALQAGDHGDALDLVAKIRSAEGEPGTLWRFGQASYLLDHARRGMTKELNTARALAAEIADRRPDWWGSSVLLAELAELESRNDDAIKNYTRAIEQGNNQPSLARRLVGLLNQKDEFEQVDRVVKILSDRGLATGDLTTATAFNAIRQQDYDRGIALARRAFSESSTNYSDHMFMGQFYIAAGRSQDAGKELRRAVELGPGVPITWVSYVQYLVREQQVQEARAAVEAARQALAVDRATVPLAQCYALVGDTKQAEAMIQAALRSPACDLTTIRVATDLYINLGRFDQVEPILDKLLVPPLKATQEDLAWATRTRSLARLSTGRMADMDGALSLAEQNLKDNPSSPADLTLKAIILAMRTSRRGEAIKLLEPLDRSNQLATNEQFILARAYLAEGLVEQYRALMLKILGARVKNPQHLVHFVDFLIDRRELDQADRWLAELKRAAPTSPSLLAQEARLLDLRNLKPELLGLLLERGRRAPEEIFTVAGLLERFGFASEAEAAYKAYSARNPGQPERALPLAAFLARQDRTKEAAAILDQAWKTCRLEAVAGTSLLLYAAPSADQHLKSRVEAWVTEAIQKSPEAANWLQTKLAMIYCNRGRYDEAEALYRRVLASDPDHVEALNNLAWELALLEPGAPREALELIDRAIERTGPTSTLVDTRAVALIRVGKAERAAEEIRKAQSGDPKNLSLALHLAWAYHASGKTVEARQALQLAEGLGLKPEARDALERDMIDRLRWELAGNEPKPVKKG